MYKIKTAILVPLFFLCISGYSQTYYVSTLAGDTAGLAGGYDTNDGYRDGTRDLALFNSPSGIAIDAAGTYLYVADTYNNVIRKITIANGLVSTLAGDTTDIKKGLDSNIGYVDASAFSAKFNNPLGVCVDDTGNVYVADTYNNVIRKIWKSGKVTTYAGRDSAGVGVPGFINGADSSAEFYLPISLAIDSMGNIYVTDNGNNAIRKISRSGMVTTVAGKGVDSAGYVNGPVDSAQFIGLYGLALKHGAVFTSQYSIGYNAIRRVYQNIATTYSGYDTIGFDTSIGVETGYRNGKSGLTGTHNDTVVLYYEPTGVGFDTLGNLLVCDEYNNVIRFINAKDSVVSTLAGNDSVSTSGYMDGLASVAQFYNPMGIVADKKGNFFVTDVGNNIIREISTNPNPTGVPAIKKSLNSLTVYPNPCSGILKIVSSFNGNAMLLDINGRVIWAEHNFKSPYILSTSGIAPGLYFLKITSSTDTEVKKIEVVK